MLKRSSLGIVYFFIAAITTAQTNQKTPLLIGDQMPDIQFENMYNYSDGKAKLSDFRGKLVILDLWNMSCLPCIKAFPKMEQFQNQYSDKLQIILVNPLDSKEGLQRMGFPSQTKSSIISKTKLPFAVLEREFLELFAVNTMPYHIWIDKNGIIVAITDGRGTTSEQIGNFLSGRPFHVRYHNAPSDLGLVDDTKGNEYKSIFIPQHKVLNDNLLYSSLITRNIGGKGFGGRIYDSVSRKLVGLRTCHNLIYLFRNCFNNWDLINNPDRVILEVSNPESYDPPNSLSDEQYAKWHENNFYAYEVKFPASRMSGNETKDFFLLQKVMLQDLERFFGVKASIEKRKLICRLLVRMDKEDKLKRKGDEYHVQVYGSNGKEGFLFNNGSITLLFSKLKYSFREFPFKPLLNETGIPDDKLFDIDINAPLGNIQAVKKELNRFGLDILESERELEVLVIKKSEDM